MLYEKFTKLSKSIIIFTPIMMKSNNCYFNCIEKKRKQEENYSKNGK